MLKSFIVAGIACAIFVPAIAAEKASCVDPHSSYYARPLSRNEIFVQNTLGKKKPPIRLLTTCHRLESALTFGLSAEFTCLGTGDTVVANLNGEKEACRVAKVLPYAPQPGDLPEKKGITTDEAKPDAK